MTSLDRTLIDCAKKGDLAGVTACLNLGADVHAWNDYALRWSAYYGRKELVKLLLENGANVHADDDYALRWSAENGHKEVVQILEDWIKSRNL